MTNLTNWQDLIDKNKASVRTQISLSAKLRRIINVKCKIYGETLSEYLRKAAVLRLMSEEEEKKELEALAKAVIGSVSKTRSGWKKIKNVNSWQSKNRRQEDKHRKI